MHALRYEPNEVTVNEEGAIEDYGKYAEELLAVRPVSCAFGCGSPNGLPYAGRRDALYHSPFCLARRRSAGPASRRPGKAPAPQARYVLPSPSRAPPLTPTFLPQK
jgi:hypothetical protein